MKKINLSFVLFLTLYSCNKEPYTPPYYMAVGYVIGKETCNDDTAKDYWLIDIYSSSSVRQQYGDTLVLNGIKYTNVVKSTQLSDYLKNTGQKVGFDFVIPDSAVLTTGCTVAMPVTYRLKVVDIISNFEWR